MCPGITLNCTKCKIIELYGRKNPHFNKEPSQQIIRGQTNIKTVLCSVELGLNLFALLGKTSPTAGGEEATSVGGAKVTVRETGG